MLYDSGGTPGLPGKVMRLPILPPPLLQLQRHLPTFGSCTRSRSKFAKPLQQVHRVCADNGDTESPPYVTHDLAYLARPYFPTLASAKSSCS